MTEDALSLKIYRIYYHFPCTDGALAALALYMAYKDDPTIVLQFVPHKTRTELSLEEEAPLCAGADMVWLLDYCGPAGFLEWVCGVSKHVRLVDHHKTAREMVDGMANPPANLEVNIDMKSSGCMLALAYGGANHLTPEMRRVFEYVEDNDIWTHRLPNSKEYSDGLAMLDLNFDFSGNHYKEQFEHMLCAIPDEHSLIQMGRDDAVRKQALITGYMNRCYVVVVIEGCAILATDIHEKHHYLISELGHQLAERSPSGIGAVYRWETQRVALRGIDGVDTTPIASLYGGGGHAGASGFTLGSAQWNKLKR